MKTTKTTRTQLGGCGIVQKPKAFIDHKGKPSFIPILALFTSLLLFQFLKGAKKKKNYKGSWKEGGGRIQRLSK
jgi:hypothetical protein